jgi:hypothetical protein
MKKTMLILIILASLIPGVLAVVQYFDSKGKERRNHKNEQALNSKIDSLKLDNTELKTQLKSLLGDNMKLSHQLTETALDLNKNVIGESDLDIQIHNTSHNEFNFRFENISNLSVINSHITIQNYTEIKKCQVLRETENEIHIKFDCYQQNFLKQTGINLNPHAAIIFDTKSFPFLNDYMTFAIQIETRKMTLIYHLVYKIIEGKIVRSYRKYSLVDKKKIFISEDNPLNLKKDFWGDHFYKKILYVD